MVFVCCATGTTNIQVIEGKHTNACLEGITKFLCETTVPKVFLIDEDGGLVKSIKDREINYRDLQRRLIEQKSIHFKTIVPQGHYGHGKVERKIGMLQESFEKSEFKTSQCMRGQVARTSS